MAQKPELTIEINAEVVEKLKQVVEQLKEQYLLTKTVAFELQNPKGGKFANVREEWNKVMSDTERVLRCCGVNPFSPL